MNPDFYAFETRIRAVILEMIDPCVKRSIQERDMIAEVKKQTEIMRKKVDECEFLIQKA